MPRDQDDPLLVGRERDMSLVAHRHWGRYDGVRRHPKTTRAILNPFHQETWAIGIRKQDITLLQSINKFLQEFKDAGGFEKLGEKFLPEEKAFFKNNNIPFYF